MTDAVDEIFAAAAAPLETLYTSTGCSGIQVTAHASGTRAAAAVSLKASSIAGATFETASVRVAPDGSVDALEPSWTRLPLWEALVYLVMAAAETLDGARAERVTVRTCAGARWNEHAHLQPELTARVNDALRAYEGVLACGLAPVCEEEVPLPSFSRRTSAAPSESGSSDSAPRRSRAREVSSASPGRAPRSPCSLGCGA